MSTNYYLKRIPTDEEIAQCHKLLDERKIEYYDLEKDKHECPYLQKVLEKMTEKVHLGSLSWGWRFLFHTHVDLYGKSIQSCLEYLSGCTKSGLWRISDEYGETISLVDFEMLVRNSLNGITTEDYYKEHPEERTTTYYAPPQELAEDGSRWWNVDFS